MRIAAATLALATAGATLTATAGLALAEERQVIVYTADLNLGAAEGRSALDVRVRSAARRVCGSLPALQVKQDRQVRACHLRALARAVDQLTATASSGQVHAVR